jgi:hypothetical protein
MKEHGGNEQAQASLDHWAEQSVRLLDQRTDRPHSSSSTVIRLDVWVVSLSLVSIALLVGMLTPLVLLAVPPVIPVDLDRLGEVGGFRLGLEGLR